MARIAGRLVPGAATLLPFAVRARAFISKSGVNRLVRGLSMFVIPALGSTLVWLLADALARQRWGDASTAAHFSAALWCVGAVAVSSGVAIAIVTKAFSLGSHAKRYAALRAVILGGIVAVLVLPIGQWTFSGTWIRNHPSARWGPGVFTLVCISMAWLFAAAMLRSIRAQSQGRFAPARLLAATCTLAGLAGVYVDLNVYVALYARLHSALEVISFALFFSGMALTFRELQLRSRRCRAVFGSVTLLAVVLAPLPVFSEDLLKSLETDLSHAFKEPIYVGRELQRVKVARAFLRDPWAWEGAQAAQLDELKREYDLVTTDLDPTWTQPLSPAAPTAACDDCNLLVFYVDTLRRDVAMDPALMPNVARFASESLNFKRAYATGSDTLNSLPGLTGGSYDLHETQSGDLLTVAKQAGMHRLLTIPKSANEFLTKLHSSFKFDETLEVADYSPEKPGVWGYGADQPSIAPLVDGLLDWLDTHRDQRFLSWLFTFEVHNWRELNDDYVEQAANRAGLNQDDKRWRYWAIAHEVDRHFGRLLAGLEKYNLADKTMVLFVSDHGEALGEWDFWLHGVMVWESLVRVPLVLRIPGVPPAAIDTPVSLVDVPVTLAPMLSGKPSSPGYQGFSLFESAAGKRRENPIMFVGQRKETLVRIGVLDPDSNYKLVLPLETGKPELYDTSSPRPDDDDLASKSPLKVANLLNIAVRSPMFPRPVEEPEQPGQK